MLQNIPCFDMIPPNFVYKCSMVYCRRNAPTLFPRRGNNREDTIFPYADVPHRNQCIICGRLKTFEFVGVVQPAANQDPMIAGGLPCHPLTDTIGLLFQCLAQLPKRPFFDPGDIATRLL